MDGCSSVAVKSSNMGQRRENPRGPEVFWSLSTSAPAHSLNVGSDKGRRKYWAEGRGLRKQQVNRICESPRARGNPERGDISDSRRGSAAMMR